MASLLKHLLDANLAPRVAAGAGVGHLVQEFENSAAVHVASKVGHVGRHQHGHRQFMGGKAPGLSSPMANSGQPG